MSYTEEEKRFHLQRMWAEGLTPKGYSDRHGAPSRGTLSRWAADWRAGLLECEMPRVPGEARGHAKHARWPEGTRAEALRLHDLGVPSRQISRALGLPPGVPGAWARARDAAAGRGRMPLPGAQGAPVREEAPVAQAEPDAQRRIAELEAALARAEEDNAVLRELMRDPKAGGPASLSPRRKAELGERLRRERGWPLSRILTFFCISRSTYHYHRRAIAAGAPGGAEAEAALDAAVLAAFEASGGTYGYRRLAAATGLPQRRVRASMARQGLEARDSRRCRGWSPCAGEVAPAQPNLLMGPRGHEFSAPAPNLRWVTDITEMRFGPGPRDKLYWSVVVDLFDGRLVAARWSASPDAELANSTLEAALATLGGGPAPLGPAGGPLVHSDRGAHYRWPGWAAICEANGVVRSMSRKGHSPDNAACEAFFGRAKVELYRGRTWRGAEHLGAALDAYALWYNSGRLKSWPEEGRAGRTRYETIDARRRRLGWAS